jgi:hypothetical protein
MRVPFTPRSGWLRYKRANRELGGEDRELRRQFLESNLGVERRFEELFRYFLTGFCTHATRRFERAHYRGMGSYYGYRISGVEGFARTAPLFASWLAGGRPPRLAHIGTQKDLDLRQVLCDAITAGCNPKLNTYWGHVRDRSQLIVEAADVALSIWLSRDHVWRVLDSATRSDVVAWLRSAQKAKGHANNWLLFGTLIEAVLASLEGRSLETTENYERFKRLYLESGWFSDAEGERVVDFYNAWGITYPLFWLGRIQPKFDDEFLREVVLQSADLTAHLISPRGLPIMGRSVCYRTAVPAPLVVATFLENSPDRLGRARRALDCVWRYFVANGAVRAGTLTQGYFGDDPRILDNYSGPGSSHWGLRSLVPAFLHPSASSFWTAMEQPLPIECGDYRIELEKLGWVVDGEKASGDIRIRIPANAGRSPTLKAYTMSHRIREAANQRAMRPDNRDAAYGAEVYSVLDPFPLRPSGEIASDSLRKR